MCTRALFLAARSRVRDQFAVFSRFRTLSGGSWVASKDATQRSRRGLAMKCQACPPALFQLFPRSPICLVRFPRNGTPDPIPRLPIPIMCSSGRDGAGLSAANATKMVYLNTKLVCLAPHIAVLKKLKPERMSRIGFWFSDGPSFCLAVAHPIAIPLLATFDTAKTSACLKQTS